LVILVEDVLSHGIRGTVIPTGVIGMVVNTDGDNDARTNICASPFPAAGDELTPDEKISVVHAGRCEVAHVHNTPATRRSSVFDTLYPWCETTPAYPCPAAG